MRNLGSIHTEWHAISGMRELYVESLVYIVVYGTIHTKRKATGSIDRDCARC